MLSFSSLKYFFLFWWTSIHRKSPYLIYFIYLYYHIEYFQFIFITILFINCDYQLLQILLQHLDPKKKEMIKVQDLFFSFLNLVPSYDNLKYGSKYFLKNSISEISNTKLKEKNELFHSLEICQKIHFCFLLCFSPW